MRQYAVVARLNCFEDEFKTATLLSCISDLEMLEGGFFLKRTKKETKKFCDLKKRRW